MYRFWETLVRPLLDARQPRTLLEIGSFEGENTALLLTYCQDHGATLHAIDPLPRFDADEWAADAGGHFVFHRAKSLEVLRDLPVADVVLIDGDHNWYTVYHELRQIAEATDAAGKPFPITLFHDIAWPYARRDLYYEPNDIPPEFRQPYERKGILPGRSRLHKYGVNQELANATHEGGPRNGVLTAVEDFMAEAAAPMRLILIDGYHGLGILYPASLVDHAPDAAAHLERLEIGVTALGPHIRGLDDQIVSSVVFAHRTYLRSQASPDQAAVERV
jgi:hypothetical protein